jgi:hypothetical protein
MIIGESCRLPSLDLEFIRVAQYGFVGRDFVHAMKVIVGCIS